MQKGCILRSSKDVISRDSFFACGDFAPHEQDLASSPESKPQTILDLSMEEQRPRILSLESVFSEP